MLPGHQQLQHYIWAQDESGTAICGVNSSLSSTNYYHSYTDIALHTIIGSSVNTAKYATQAYNPIYQAPGIRQLQSKHD